ncbi:hypothetical protein [Geodermatophilus sp. SYSU D00815]
MVSAAGEQAPAWRAVVAEAWSRARRRVVVVLLAGAVLAGTGLCGTPRVAEPPAPPSTSAPAR